MGKSVLQDKAYVFALRVVRLSEYLNKEKKEYVLSRKVLDSGTAIAVFVEEANQSHGHADFISRLSLSNKEAFKTNLWLRLLRDAEFIKPDHAESMLSSLAGRLRYLATRLQESPAP